MSNFWHVLLGAGIAITSGIVTQFILDWHKRRIERLSLESAIVGEIEAILASAKHRGYVEGLRQEIAFAEANSERCGWFHFAVRQNHTRVYEANLGRIGILTSPMPKDVVIFYEGVSSIYEYAEGMREEKIKRTPAEQLRVLKEFLVLFEDTLSRGQRIIDNAET